MDYLQVNFDLMSVIIVLTDRAPEFDLGGRNFCINRLFIELGVPAIPEGSILLSIIIFKNII